MAKQLADINTNWSVRFDTNFGGPSEPVGFPKLVLWNNHDNPAIKYYSGQATYTNRFNLSDVSKDQPVYLSIDSVFNIATVIINGID
ncbi:MAG TPA: hypothetical protein VL943_01310, partial [Niabella sp.]|nr:hypothetical protein [Niabella sp.]